MLKGYERIVQIIHFIPSNFTSKSLVDTFVVEYIGGVEI
jgi:hypothetical protein